MGSMFLNSVLLSVAMPLINLFFCACTAYAYAVHDFKGKQILYWVAMIPMLVNITGTLPSQYNLYVKLGIYDSIPGILLTATNGFGFPFCCSVVYSKLFREHITRRPKLTVQEIGAYFYKYIFRNFLRYLAHNGYSDLSVFGTTI